MDTGLDALLRSVLALSSKAFLTLCTNPEYGAEVGAVCLGGTGCQPLGEAAGPGGG